MTYLDARDRQEARDMSETRLRELVMAEAKKFGWMRSAFGWSYGSRKVIKGDPGFPDVVLARPPILLVVELKREGEKPEPPQERWHAVLRACGTIVVKVWRPSDWISGRIQEYLA
jgi:hypothetical protein